MRKSGNSSNAAPELLLRMEFGQDHQLVAAKQLARVAKGRGANKDGRAVARAYDPARDGDFDATSM